MESYFLVKNTFQQDILDILSILAITRLHDDKTDMLNRNNWFQQ